MTTFKAGVDDDRRARDDPLMGRLLVAGVVALTLVAAPFSGAAVSGSSGIVASVFDGDTISLTDGRRLRLLQIDTPELGTGECFSRASRKVLLKLVPIGSRVTLEPDPRLDDVDFHLTWTAPISERWAWRRSGALEATRTASTVTTTGLGASEIGSLAS